MLILSIRAASPADRSHSAEQGLRSLGWSWGLQKSVSSGGKLGGKTELKTRVRGVLVRGTGEEKVVCLRPWI